MIRNLMLILGLSLAVAAFGCDSSSSNGGGSGGTAGTGGTAGGGGSAGGAGGDGGAGGEGGSAGPTDACTNEADLAIVCLPSFQDEAVVKCATEAVGQPGPTAMCLVEDTGVSAACAACYGGVSGCILANCLAAGCAGDPNSQGCLDCRAEFCDDDFNACTGDLETGCAE